MEKKSFWEFSFKNILTTIILLVIVGVGGYFGYSIYTDLKQEIQQLNTEYAQLSETLARAHSEMATKSELRDFAKQLGVDLGKIKDDMTKLGVEIRAVGTTVASIEGKIEQNQSSDNVIPHDPPQQPETCKLCDIHNYTANIQAKDLVLGEMPYGRAEFDASKDTPWTIAYDDIDVNVDTVLGEGDDPKKGLVFYHEISLSNKSRLAIEGQKFKLKIVSSEFKQFVDSSKEWYWWAPHINIQADNIFAFSEDDFYKIGGSLGLSIMAWGNTKDDNILRVLRVGVGINSDKNAYVTLEPLQYNLGAHLPLISDLWLGVGAIYDGDWGVSLSIGTTL